MSRLNSIFGGKAVKGKIFSHDANDEHSGNSIIFSSIEALLNKVKLSKESEYLETWRKDWIERMDRIINWAVQSPDNFPDVIAVLNEFEMFYGKMIMVIAQTENLKEHVEDIRKSRENADVNGPEIR